MKKFNENLQTAVLTSKYVVKNTSIIVSVTHHEDGIWEFFGAENISEQEIMVVSLGQIIQIDPSLLEIADLPIMYTAYRKSKNDKWQYFSKN